MQNMPSCMQQYTQDILVIEFYQRFHLECQGPMKISSTIGIQSVSITEFMRLRKWKAEGLTTCDSHTYMEHFDTSIKVKGTIASIASTPYIFTSIELFEHLL